MICVGALRVPRTVLRDAEVGEGVAAIFHRLVGDDAQVFRVLDHEAVAAEVRQERECHYPVVALYASTYRPYSIADLSPGVSS